MQVGGWAADASRPVQCSLSIKSLSLPAFLPGIQPVHKPDPTTFRSILQAMPQTTQLNTDTATSTTKLEHTKTNSSKTTPRTQAHNIATIDWLHWTTISFQSTTRTAQYTHQQSPVNRHRISNNTNSNHDNYRHKTHSQLNTNQQHPRSNLTSRHQTQSHQQHTTQHHQLRLQPLEKPHHNINPDRDGIHMHTFSHSICSTDRGNIHSVNRCISIQSKQYRWQKPTSRQPASAT